MKTSLKILICATIVITLAGCKKKSFDPASKGQSDFVGTWTGTLTSFKNNKLVKETGTFLIFPAEGGTGLDGIIYLSETRSFKQFQFTSGTLYFRVANTDPASAFCQNWNLSGYASFTDETTMTIRISGNECGLSGNEYVDWSGTLGSLPTKADSLPCFTFARESNNWTYNVGKKNGDSCHYQKLLATKSGTYNFNGETTHNCDWMATNIPVKWTVNPAEFIITDDATLTNHPITVPIFALPGVVYTSLVANDTVTLSLIKKNDTVTCLAGTYLCNKYRYTETVASGAGRTTRSAYLWLHYHFGIIRQTVDNPVNATDVKTLLLKTKFISGS